VKKKIKQHPKIEPALSPCLEDYLEAIYVIEQKQAISRVKDIALYLGVRAASVTGALQSLSAKRLVNYKPYEYITLTDKGLAEAKRIYNRHKLLKSFFIKILGVNEDIADSGACNAEHTIPDLIMEKIGSFVEYASQNEVNEIIEKFKNNEYKN
jgi:DtxR family transcriptional regulator, Mn-dependent transcriptional regulator